MRHVLTVLDRDPETSTMECMVANAESWYPPGKMVSTSLMWLVLIEGCLNDSLNFQNARNGNTPC